MKKYLLSMICAASVVMFVACDDDNSGSDDNPVAGTDGNYCWKVTTNIMEGISNVSYMWDNELSVKAYVAQMQASGLDIEYEKSSAKDYNECSKLQDGTADDLQSEIDKWLKGDKYESAEPGIYVNSERELVAKGTDGSVFIVPDTADFSDVVAPGVKPFYPTGFKAWDGQMSIYEFTMDCYNDNDGNWLTASYQDTVGTVRVGEYASSGILTSIDLVKTEFTLPFASFDDYTKIAEAGDFVTTYKAIATMLQKAGPIVAPADMVQKYTKYACQWLSDRYPAAMEQAKYVIPYTGSGNIQYMRVDREFEGGKTPDGYVWLYPCDVDDVVEIEVLIENVSKEDADAYIQKVKTEGVYSQFNESNDIFTANSDNYYDEGVHGPAPEGTKGFVFPTYSVLYVNGNLFIKYTLSKVVYV